MRERERERERPEKGVESSGATLLRSQDQQLRQTRTVQPRRPYLSVTFGGTGGLEREREREENEGREK